MNKSQSFFKKDNKIDELLKRLTKKKTKYLRLGMRKKTTIDTEEIKRILRKYYLQLDSNTFEKLVEMGNFQLYYKLYKLTKKEKENYNIAIIITEI